MAITEDQRKRAEANRLAALKRKALVQSTKLQQQEEEEPQQQQNVDSWALFKCQKISSKPTTHFPKQCENLSLDHVPTTNLHQKFRVRLEICSPDSFLATPVAEQGFANPGEDECLRRLNACLSNVIISHYTQNNFGGKACVYKLRDYEMVLRCLKDSKNIEVEEIPWSTFNVVDRLSNSFGSERWIGCRPEHLSDEKVEELIQKLPKTLLNALLPFQLDGVRFGLRRGGRCLIADEMGLGKTLQAIAIACCFMNEGSILVVCPAILRFSWAEELERWLPFCLPTDVHLVFGHQDDLSYLMRCPKVVVISYTMLRRLRKRMLAREWSVLIVDESHHVRCTKKKTEPKEIKAVLDVATKVKRMVLLSGTPSLSRPYDIFHQINMLWPGLLGKDKYEFANTYCAVKVVRGCQGKYFQDFSKGIRLEELNVLLKQTVMIRRLKEHVLQELPPKRRQIIRLLLAKSIIASAKDAVALVNANTSEKKAAGEIEPENDQPKDSRSIHKSEKLSYQELGVAKLSGFHEWLSIHPLITKSDGVTGLDLDPGSNKMIIFAHHHKVLDGVQEFLIGKGIEFVRIDGNTLARDRQIAVQLFQSSVKVKIAIIGITAGGVGLDLSSAQNVVFLELPQSPSVMQQAEDRAHRRGQTKAVNIYIFCAKDTLDERLWENLNKSLQRVSSTTNGKYDAIQEIEVESVSDLKTYGRTDGSCEDHIENKSSSEVIAQKVENVSYLETSGGTNRYSEKHNFEEEACGEISAELKKLSYSGLAQDMRPFQVHNEIDAKQCDRSDDYINIEQVDVVSDLGLQKVSIFNGKLDGNLSVAEIGSPERVSTKDWDPQTMVNVISDLGVEKISGFNGKLDGNFSVHEIESPGRVYAKDKDPQTMERLFYHQTTNIGDGKPVQPTEADESSSHQVKFLRFEVSRYTGRVHLYSCSLGTNSRPMPLYENFRQEELDSSDCPAANDNKRTSFKSFKDNPACRHALQTFINEWNKLRPIEKRKLFGKPLQLPLTAELCYLNESLNHSSGGRLKGGSKRRTTPLCEISNALPTNAVWKKVHLARGSEKKEKEYTQGWTLTDEPLCKLCQTPCKGSNAKSPDFLEDLFCNLNCYDEYRIRTSNRYLRQELFNIEHGICTNCRLDCHQLIKRLKPLSRVSRQEYIEKVAPEVARRKKLLEKLVNDPTEGNAWHADHIIPVYGGGGECQLDNMRTLCVACHYVVTVTQCAERRSTRVEARKQLKVAIKNLKSAQNMGGVDTELKEKMLLEMQEKQEEDELLVMVPGSAYSEVKNVDISSNDLAEKYSEAEV